MVLSTKSFSSGRLGREFPKRATPAAARPLQIFPWPRMSLTKTKTASARSAPSGHRITAWGKLAEICQQYLKKGTMVYIEGRIQSREWQDKEGQKRISYDIVANTMKMLSFAC